MKYKRKYFSNINFGQLLVTVVSRNWTSKEKLCWQFFYSVGSYFPLIVWTFKLKLD